MGKGGTHGVWKQPVSIPKSLTLVFVEVCALLWRTESFAFKSHFNHLTYNWESSLSYPIFISCAIYFILEIIFTVMYFFMGRI